MDANRANCALCTHAQVKFAVVHLFVTYKNYKMSVWAGGGNHKRSVLHAPKVWTFK